MSSPKVPELTLVGLRVHSQSVPAAFASSPARQTRDHATDASPFTKSEMPHVNPVGPAHLLVEIREKADCEIREPEATAPRRPAQVNMQRGYKKQGRTVSTGPAHRIINLPSGIDDAALCAADFPGQDGDDNDGLLFLRDIASSETPSPLRSLTWSVPLPAAAEPRAQKVPGSLNGDSDLRCLSVSDASRSDSDSDSDLEGDSPSSSPCSASSPMMGPPCDIILSASGSTTTGKPDCTIPASSPRALEAARVSLNPSASSVELTASDSDSLASALSAITLQTSVGWRRWRATDPPRMCGVEERSRIGMEPLVAEARVPPEY